MACGWSFENALLISFAALHIAWLYRLIAER